MSEQTVETPVETTVVPFYKNKKFVLTAAAVTAAVVVMGYLKFKSSNPTQSEEPTDLTSDTSSPEK